MKMQNTEMEFVAFDAQDVIATSGKLTFTWSGLGDNSANNAKITMNKDGVDSVIFAMDSTKDKATNINNVAAALNEALGITSVNKFTRFYHNDAYCRTIEFLVDGDMGGGRIDDYDLTYEWIAQSSWFKFVQ